MFPLIAVDINELFKSAIQHTPAVIHSRAGQGGGGGGG